MSQCGLESGEDDSRSNRGKDVMGTIRIVMKRGNPSVGIGDPRPWLGKGKSELVAGQTLAWEGDNVIKGKKNTTYCAREVNWEDWLVSIGLVMSC